MRPLKVIGAGQHRTGTYSMTFALNILGVECFHPGFVLLPVDLPVDQAMDGSPRDPLYPKGLNLWIDMMKHGADNVDLQGYFDERNCFDACVDMPYAFDELLRLHPDAKFILTVRDPESWWRSYWKALWSIDYYRLILDMDGAKPDREPEFLDWLGHELRRTYGPHKFSKELALQFLKTYEDHVKASVPPSQLLVFDVKSGWGPLCDFLGVPVPDVPFPRINEFDSLSAIMDLWLANARKLLPGVDIAKEYAWPNVDG
ncbi:P-loop containing nucleoside triphosphate hydrolase protein [Hyaloraphidium curvatum]|nr:P-loop containing nucleoside triphosphate hydrolase protein [Hyaloraphidium curvatum]